MATIAISTGLSEIRRDVVANIAPISKEFDKIMGGRKNPLESL
jgi:hypothetical protein